MISDKQYRAILFIQQLTNNKFEGTNGHEAWVFIKENIEKAQEKSSMIACNRSHGESKTSISYKNERRERSENRDYGFSINCKDDMNSYGW